MKNATMIETLKNGFNVAEQANTSVGPTKDGTFLLTTWSTNWLTGEVENRLIEEVDEEGLLKRLQSDGVHSGWSLRF